MSCWISDSFSHETQVLTKALQISLSQDSTSSSSSSSFLLDLTKSEPPTSASDLNFGSNRARNQIPVSKSGKISKRKSRASKRCPMTVINADPANFRAMVQQVTGVRIGDVDRTFEPVLRPEPQRVVQQSFLPTLDTSAFFLDRDGVVGPVNGGGQGSFGPVVQGSGFDVESILSFPTLESWGVM